MSKTIPKNRNSANYERMMPVTDYLAAKIFRNERTWTISDGILFTELDGVKMTRQDFDLRFPIPAPLYYCRSNPDTTKNYLH